MLGNANHVWCLWLLGAEHLGNPSVGQTCSAEEQEKASCKSCSRADAMIRCESGWMLQGCLFLISGPVWQNWSLKN